MEGNTFEDILVHSEEFEQQVVAGQEWFADTYGDELTHHGVKDQEWYKRRYQNPDGSLTALGRVHYGVGKAREGVEKTQSAINKIKAYNKKKKAAKKRREALEKARATREANVKAAAERKKKLDADKLSVKEMTNEEIQQRIDRLDLEKKYKEAINSADGTNAINRGKRFTNKFIDATLDKVAENSGADAAAQAIKVVFVKGINKGLAKKGFDADVHTNNKKKN